MKSKFLASAIAAAAVVTTLGLAYAQTAADPAPKPDATMQSQPMKPATDAQPAQPMAAPAPSADTMSKPAASSDASTPAAAPAATASQDPMLANKADRN